MDDEKKETSLKRAFDIGMARQQAGDFDGAIRAWRAILLQNADSVAALNNLGIALRRTGRIAESEAVLRAGIERHPLTAELHVSLGQTRQEWGRQDEAEQEFIRATALASNTPGPHHALGILYLEQGRLDDGIRALKASLHADPVHVPALVALANALTETGDNTAAAGHISTALAQDPSNREAHLALADLLLLAEDYPAGFRELKWRHEGPEREDARDLLNEDKDLGGRSITVECDGWFSETFLLIRLLRDIKGGPISLRCDPALVEILRGSGWLEDVRGKGPADEHDKTTAIPLSQIPSLIGLDMSSVPNTVPYLRPDPSSLSHWRSRLPQDGICVGINWSGGDGNVPLAAFKDLAAIDGIHLVSLQKGEARRDLEDCGFPVLDLGKEIDEATGAFVDSAALISVLPLVVGNQSPLVHLAGAMDRPAWVLLPPTPHWCFGLHGDQTAWYPSIEIFRKDARESWGFIMTKVVNRVTDLRSRTMTHRH